MEELREKLLYQETLDLDDGDTRSILMDLIDKDTAMKPDIYPNGRFYIFECSECGITVSGVNKYCHKCGQKFNWED